MDADFEKNARSGFSASTSVEYRAIYASKSTLENFLSQTLSKLERFLSLTVDSMFVARGVFAMSPKKVDSVFC